MASDIRSTPDVSRVFDVLVVGGGNAALCAAMTAREAGATVLLLESSPRECRAATAATRATCATCTTAATALDGPLLEEEFMKDLLLVTKGQTNEELARHTIRESRNVGLWMERHGCRFQPAMRGTLHLAAPTPFSSGAARRS